MGVEHYNQSEAYSDALDIMNIIFTTIFTLEATVKIIGMRWHYFRRAWNVFDFLIVILSIIGKRVAYSFYLLLYLLSIFAKLYIYAILLI